MGDAVLGAQDQEYLRPGQEGQEGDGGLAGQGLEFAVGGLGHFSGAAGLHQRHHHRSLLWSIIIRPRPSSSSSTQKLSPCWLQPPHRLSRPGYANYTPMNIGKATRRFVTI